MAKFDIEEALAGAQPQGGRFNVDEAIASKTDSVVRVTS